MNTVHDERYPDHSPDPSLPGAPTDGPDLQPPAPPVSPWAPQAGPVTPDAPASSSSQAPHPGPAARPAQSASPGGPAAPSGPGGADPAPGAPGRRRGPGWGGVTALVAAGMLLSSGVTLGGVVAYDQVVEPLTAASTSQTPQVPATSETSPVALAPEDVDWSAVAERVAPSAAAIQVAGSGGTSQGTGVVLDADGSILTNAHVVGEGGEIQVTLTDGLSYSASVIGSDPTTDLAVIRMDTPPEGLQPATFGASSDVEVGQPVMAVGTPLGLENTVTTGIVSAVDRPVTTAGEETDGSDATFTSALQTDAAINPGNSGGPLVDASGQVIGINTAIAGIPDATGQAGSIGLGFAIPADTAEMISEQLSASGDVQHAFLGVTSTDGSKTVGDITYRGAEVLSVEPDSPAQQAGLEEGDLITALDDVTVGGAAALTGVVRGLPVGSDHTLTVLRDGEQETAEVTLVAGS